MTKVYFVSDIHLELRKDKQSSEINIDPSDASDCYLALSGDIGNPFSANYHEFIKRHSRRFKHIFVVSGNHEYYTSNNKQRTMKEIDDKLQSISDEFPNVSFLQKSGVSFEGVLFLGCTFWTPADETCELLMNDYSHVYVESAVDINRYVAKNGWHGGKKKLKAHRRQLTAQDIMEKHLEYKGWIQKQTEAVKDEKTKIVVITHHPPTHKMLHGDHDPALKNGYASTCENLLKPPVKAWLSGHTHYSQTVEVNGVICASNCFGYPNQKETKFAEGSFIEI